MTLSFRIRVHRRSSASHKARRRWPLPALAALLLVLPLASQTKQHRKPKPLPQGAVTHDWTSFLGPTHNAVSTETKLTPSFPDSGPPLVWEFPKGAGYSSPAIQGDKLVFFHRVANNEVVIALHPETGDKLWEFTYPTTYEDRYGYSNGPRSSPVIDQDRVYTVGAQGKLHCLRLDTGKQIWQRDLPADYKIPQDFFGTASTPLIDGPNLIVQLGAPGGPTVVALDKFTGKQVWAAGKDWGPSYASPIPATVHGKRRIFVFAGGESNPPTGGLLVIDPATGKLEATFPWRSKSYESVNASCPTIFDNKVLISATYKTGAALLNLLPTGKLETAWTAPDFDLHFNTAIHDNGVLYAFPGRNEPDAFIAAIDAKTGKDLWREKLEWEEKFTANGQERRQMLSTFRGNLLKADGRYIALGELGHLLFLDLTPKGVKIQSRAWLFAARESWTPPVLSRGLLYITQNNRDVIHGTTPRLLCYDLRGK